MSEDKSVKKVDSSQSPVGEMGQTYLASGKAVSMRLWDREEPSEPKPEARREYETVGYVIDGRAGVAPRRTDGRPGKGRLLDGPEGRIPHL